MMVNCPKCGFNQPQDRYCASCGIDMVSFKPAQKPLLTRVIQNTSFQITGLATVAIVLGTYVHSQNKNAEMDKRMSELAAEDLQSQDQPAAPANRYQKEAEEARIAANTYAEQQARDAESRLAENDRLSSQSANFASTKAAVEPQTETTSSSSQAALAPTATASASPSPSASPSAAANAAGANAAAPQSLQIYFVEIPRPALNDLFAQARQSGGDGVMNFAVVQDAQTKLNALRGLRRIEVVGDYPVRMNQPSIAFKGTHDQQTNQNVGFTVQAIPVAAEEGGSIRFQIDVNRVLKDPAAGLDSFNFILPDSFVIQKKSAAILTGALPHRPLFEGEAQAYRNSSVLRTMATQSFRQGLTDVAIVIEAK